MNNKSIYFIKSFRTEHPSTKPVSGVHMPEKCHEMEALLVRKLGDPTLPPNGSENSPLDLSTSHPIPNLSTPTSVRVRVKATSLNFANYLQVLGKYQEKPPLPFIPGSDYSGFIDAVGPNVTKFRIGDPVCSFIGLGSFAQFVVADESDLFRVPDGCDLVAAGALPVAYGTSHVALVHRAQLRPKHVLLVLGAAGGVGLSAVQIGKVCGATVIAVARGNEKVQLLKSLGVDHAVDLSNANVIESVKGFLKSRKLKGVDVLYDPVGGKLTKDSLKLLNWGAQILVIGFASGEVPVIPANIALVKNWTIHGLYWGSHKIHQPNVLGDSLNELLSLLCKGLITINISHTFSLAEVQTHGLLIALSRPNYQQQI
ncbi:quinone oxidoreductase-like protein 2 homolog isoform X1 [Capsicum annuum]|uniref:quinone oxidoreductase-like protein 2 homolog isoform X1 n=1 Tax=Capsicum annuum TaxID=4072 RepID=UPI001FB18634|nr:quinone oxidoreductase-like protein 2 homolog isoform X1 [Capsicum annuum]